MATIKAHTLSGFMELLPAPQTQMERLMEVLRSSYGVYGFTPVSYTHLTLPTIRLV